jgi:methyl-accepting chemotaxis protein
VLLPKRSIPSYGWLLSAFLAAALVCSSLVALGVAGSWLGFASAVFVVAGFTTWVRAFVRNELPLRRIFESIKNKEKPDAVEISGADSSTAIWREICQTRSRDRDVVRICYEIAARLCCARRVSLTDSRAVLEAVESAGRRCEQLRGRFRQLRDGSGPLSLRSEPGCSGTDILAAPSDGADGANPVLKSVFDEIVASAREMAELLREVDQNAKDLMASTEETAYSMSRLDSFLQDMANSGKELESSTDTANRVALEGTKVVGEMAKENEAIITTVKEAADAVEDLGRWSQEVGKIVEVIRDIADETNLLALNAAIIAAQSGEHGKAFGVVAEEIRGLAERTSSSTQEIRDLVNTVQKNVANVMQGMKKSLQRVERGELLTRNAGMVLEKVFESFESSRSMAKQIATSTFEHKIDSSHVVRSIQRVADIARRLESRKFGKWTAAGEVLAAAKMVKVLAQGANAGEPSSQPTTFESAATGTLVAHSGSSPGTHDHTQPGHPGGVALAAQTDIDEILTLLESISQSIGVWVARFDEVVDSATSAVKGIPVDFDSAERVNCWDITHCDEDTRSRCEAYKQGDWRCFLIMGPAGAPSPEGGGQGTVKCTECPAFKNNLESL